MAKQAAVQQIASDQINVLDTTHKSLTHVGRALECKIRPVDYTKNAAEDIVKAEARLQKLQEQKQRIGLQLEAIEKKLPQLLAVELGVKKELENCRSELNKEEKPLVASIEKAQSDIADRKQHAILIERVASQGLYALDWRQFLGKIRSQTALPVFGIFNAGTGAQAEIVWERWIDEQVNSVKFVYEKDRRTYMRISNFYLETGKLLAQAPDSRFRNFSSFKISAELQGEIPEKSRSTIREACKNIITPENPNGLWEEVLILAEVTEWKVERRGESKFDKDPIVVGRIGEYLFHLDDFDLTDLELDFVSATLPRKK